MALPNGYCALPLQQKCEYANACLTCPVFVTTPEFLPQHHRQLEQTQNLITQTDNNGHQRMTEMNRTVEKNLLTIIGDLTASGGCCGGGSRAPAPEKAVRMPADHTHHLAEHARQRHDQTLQRAQQTLTELTDAGEHVTVAQLANQAGVSRS
jgi:hypothetical protein